MGGPKSTSLGRVIGGKISCIDRMLLKCCLQESITWYDVQGAEVYNKSLHLPVSAQIRFAGALKHTTGTPVSCAIT